MYHGGEIGGDKMNTSDLSLLETYIPLKKYTNDIAADLFYILKDRFDRYKKHLDEITRAQMETAISDLGSIAGNTGSGSDNFRVYMFTDLQKALYAGTDFSNSEIWKLIEYVNDKMAGCTKRLRAKPEYVTTLYIFKDNMLFFVHDIFAAELSDITLNYRKHDILIHKMK